MMVRGLCLSDGSEDEAGKKGNWQKGEAWHVLLYLGSKGEALKETGLTPTTAL